MKNRYDSLEELANQLNADAWAVTGQSEHWQREVRDSSGQGVAWCSTSDIPLAHRRAKFIAAANPAAILGLIADVRALAEALEVAKAKLEWYMDDHHSPMDESDHEAMERIEAARKRIQGEER